MQELTAHLHLEVAPDVAALPAARSTVRSFLAEYLHNNNRPAIEAVVLCLQEAMKNAVRFAKTEEPFAVDVRLAGHAIEVTIKDVGVGFHPVPDVVLLAEADCDAPNGRGLHLIACLSDELQLSNDGGAEVRLVKYLPGHPSR